MAVVVALVLAGGLSLSKLLGSGGLGGGVQVLNLSLTEDAAAMLLCVPKNSVRSANAYIQVLLLGDL